MMTMTCKGPASLDVVHQVKHPLDRKSSERVAYHGVQ